MEYLNYHNKDTIYYLLLIPILVIQIRFLKKSPVTHAVSKIAVVPARFHKFRFTTNDMKRCRSSRIGFANISTHPDQLFDPQYVALRTCPYQRSLPSLYVHSIEISPPLE